MVDVVVVLYRRILLNPRQARSRTNSLFLSIANESKRSEAHRKLDASLEPVKSDPMIHFPGIPSESSLVYLKAWKSIQL